MSMVETLFGLIPASSKGQQWIAEDLQLINWGGYDGHHRLRFSPEATMLCGGSGSGKSTLMDAYIALMMPHTTPFNGASNGGVTGRARGDEQRNILSYGRGKLDETRTEEGTHVRVLRGDNADTWTAVAMTWADHDGTRFTAVRGWYIPAGARSLEETVRIRATVEGSFDIRELEQAAAQRFADSSVRQSGLETLSTDREFSSRIHTVLGIGAAGAGSAAMNLLARIQAGQQITTVDELYKRMVLEEPETLATADAVVSHFDELETTRQQMVTAQKQVRALQPIRQMRSRIEEAAQQLQLIDQIGQFNEDSPAELWRTSHRLQLLRAVETELQTAARAAENELRTCQAAADAAEAERDAQAEVIRKSGGDRLETAERELAAAQRKLSDVQDQRVRFDEITANLSEQITTAADFTALHRQARTALEDPAAKREVREAYVQARSKADALAKQVKELEAERDHTAQRTHNIPSALHESRRLLAQAAGLEETDLPFVAELIEVGTEYEPWREAFNLALGGFATTVLIDQEQLSSFREAINTVNTPVRLRYQAVGTDITPHIPADSATLPGRLEYRTTPVTGWLQQRLTQQFNFTCVDSAAQLTQYSHALTITGQVSQGSRGSHGGQGRANVLGFSSRRRHNQLGEEIAVVSSELENARAKEREAADQLDSADARFDAYSKILELRWEQIDVATATSEQRRWEKIISEITEGSPKIAAWQQQITQLKQKAAQRQEETGRAKGRQAEINQRWALITDQVDAAQQVLDVAEDQGSHLTQEQNAYLVARFTAADGEETTTGTQKLEKFDAACATASRRLREDQRAAQQVVAEQREHLRRTLESFLENWPNPNLRADPDTSVKDFESILERLETSGLHELEAEWRNSLLQLSGNDLTNLDSVLGRSLRQIRERIEPINTIMADLPYYDSDHRLRISARESQSEARRNFRRDLREVRSLIETAAEDTQREEAYQRMSRLISRIRRNAPDFTDLIDVRQHVRISAEKIHAATGEHVALYDHIGEKSGGESQELIAFIVGAALRYQLGDADAKRPRYAPVFLDEALIKADAHFTQRAIGAWRGLGFQLIIGAPNDKYSAIEPHVDVEYDILKDTRGRSWAKLKVALPS